MSTPEFIHYDTREPYIGREVLVFELQDILDNFGTGEGSIRVHSAEVNVAVKYPEFYAFLMTANVGDSKSGMYGQGTYDCWERIS